jgi:hypothetical protein
MEQTPTTAKKHGRLYLCPRSHSTGKSTSPLYQYIYSAANCTPWRKNYIEENPGPILHAILHTFHPQQIPMGNHVTKVGTLSVSSIKVQ